MFPYYYKGGEIHCLKYGSHYSDTEKLFELMKQEEEFILHTNRRLKIWVDFYKTTITEQVLQQFIAHITNLHARIDKLSIVGLTRFNMWKIGAGKAIWDISRKMPMVNPLALSR